MKTFRTVLVDDEPLALARLHRMLCAHPEVAVVGLAASAEEANATIHNLHPDLLFLDIQLGASTAFDLLQGLSDPPAIIFTTAYDEYALQAFETPGIDYLLKPVEPERLDRALAKLRRLVTTDSGSHGAPAIGRAPRALPTASVDPGYLCRVGVRLGDRTIVLNVDEVAYFAADDKYVLIHTTTGKQYIVDFALSQLQDRLDPLRFVRVHRSSLVNLDHIREIQKWFGGRYRVVLGDASSTALVVSKRMARNLRAVLPF